MKNFILFFVFFIFCEKSFSFDDSSLLMPVGSNKPKYVDDKDLSGLVWNRYTTGNFTILSINNSTGKWLYNNIENIKSWSMNRWGLPNLDLKNECRIMVVSDNKLLNKLFNINQSRFEIRDFGDSKIHAIWVVVESQDDLLNNIPYFVSICSYYDLLESRSIEPNFCVINGISCLNTSVDNIRNTISRGLDKKLEENFYNISLEKYNFMTQEDRDLYNSNSILQSLMLRKEFGQNKMIHFLLNNKDLYWSKLESVYGFTKEEYDNTLKRYRKDFFSEFNLNKVPGNYLNIRRR